MTYQPRNPMHLRLKKNRMKYDVRKCRHCGFEKWQHDIRTGLVPDKLCSNFEPQEGKAK